MRRRAMRCDAIANTVHVFVSTRDQISPPPSSAGTEAEPPSSEPPSPRRNSTRTRSDPTSTPPARPRVRSSATARRARGRSRAAAARYTAPICTCPPAPPPRPPSRPGRLPRPALSRTTARTASSATLNTTSPFEAARTSTATPRLVTQVVLDRDLLNHPFLPLVVIAAAPRVHNGFHGVWKKRWARRRDAIGVRVQLDRLAVHGHRLAALDLVPEVTISKRAPRPRSDPVPARARERLRRLRRSNRRPQLQERRRDAHAREVVPQVREHGDDVAVRRVRVRAPQLPRLDVLVRRRAALRGDLDLEQVPHLFQVRREELVLHVRVRRNFLRVCWTDETAIERATRGKVGWAGAGTARSGTRRESRAGSRGRHFAADRRARGAVRFAEGSIEPRGRRGEARLDRSSDVRDSANERRAAGNEQRKIRTAGGTHRVSSGDPSPCGRGCARGRFVARARPSRPAVDRRKIARIDRQRARETVARRRDD
eukprot:31323-Pelagococcus_subviridis.AAC.20